MPVAGSHLHMNPEEFSTYYQLGCLLLQNQAYADAYQLFEKLEQTHPGVSFNLALCHIAVQDWNSALSCLEQALLSIKKYPMPLPSSSAYLPKLLEVQLETCKYQSPIPESAPDLAPGYVKDMILCVSADVCMELGLHHRVQTIAAALGRKRYANIYTLLDSL